MSEQYSLADVQQILKQASILEQENTITRKQLLEIASEVGISSATLHQAEKSWLLKQKTNQLKLIQQSRRQMGSPYKTVEVENSWAFSGMGARIKSCHSN